MDFSKLVLSRRTVHNYRAEPVSEDVVLEALSLGLWAMNHRLTFPWVYVLAGPEARARLADLAVELKGAKEPLSEVKAKATRETVLNPSYLVFLGLKRSEPKQEHEDYATLAASVQLTALALWQKGIGSKWSTGGFALHSRTYEILGLNPAEVKLEGALMIGVPAVVPSAPERPALEQFLRRTK
jgi:nitroreductase